MTAPLDEKPFPSRRLDAAKEVQSRTTDSSAPLDEKGLKAAAQAVAGSLSKYVMHDCETIIRAYLSHVNETPKTEHVEGDGLVAKLRRQHETVGVTDELRAAKDAYDAAIAGRADAGLKVVAHAEVLAGRVTAVRLDKSRHCTHGMVLASQAQSALSAMAAERDEALADHDKSLEELGRIIMSLPSGTRSNGALAGVKLMKTRIKALEEALRPFAAVADALPEEQFADSYTPTGKDVLPSMRSFRAARTTLQKEQADG